MSDARDIDYAVIGGSGFTTLAPLNAPRREMIRTPYAESACEILVGDLFGKRAAFLPRHGRAHSIPPHRINYRANIYALKSLSVARVIAFNAVGGIAPALQVGDIVVPDQIIDRTSARAHTFYDGDDARCEHIDFTHPYDEGVRQLLLNAGRRAGLQVIAGGCYAATQGPRLETAAEIKSLARDGADIVGMTGMPEAALARELALPYASLSFVINRAAGLSDAPLTMDALTRNLESTGKRVLALCEYL